MSAFHLRPDTRQVFLLWSLDAKTVLACPLCRGDIRVTEKINLSQGKMEDGSTVVLSGMALCFSCGHAFGLQHVRVSVKLCLDPALLSSVDGNWTGISFVEHRERAPRARRRDQVPVPEKQQRAVSSEPKTPDIASAIALYYAGRHVL